MLLTNKDREFLNKKCPGLIEVSTNVIEGVIPISAKYDEKSKNLLIDVKSPKSLQGKFNIRITFFPDRFPEVAEINGDLVRGLDFHIYQDGKFCLTHTLFEKKYKNKPFEYILENFVIPFLYNQVHYLKKGFFLWEYGHNHEGTFEYIYDNHLSKNDCILILKSIKKFLGINQKSFLYGKEEKNKIIEQLNLSTSKSQLGLQKFIGYLKNHTNLFKKYKNMTGEIITLVDNTILSTNLRNWLEIGIVLGGVFFIFLYFLSPKLKMYASLYRNLSKKIYILLPDSKEDYMHEEEKIIKNSIFPTKNIRVLKGYSKLSNLEESSLIIVYYSPLKIVDDIEQNIIGRAKSKKVPVIFYSKGEENKVTNDHFSLINKNDYLINNSLFRLMSDMYAIMSLYNSK